MIGEAPSPRRALLLSALAVELQWGPEVERRMSLAGASLDLARAIGDEDALTTVLMRAWALLDGSTPYHDELERLNDEALQIARRRGDTLVEWEVLTNRGFLAGCRGDGDCVRSELRIRSRADRRTPTADGDLADAKSDGGARGLPGRSGHGGAAGNGGDGARTQGRPHGSADHRCPRCPALPDPDGARPDRRAGRNSREPGRGVAVRHRLARCVGRRAHRDRPDRRGTGALPVARRRRLRPGRQGCRVQRHPVRAGPDGLPDPAGRGRPPRRL